MPRLKTKLDWAAGFPEHFTAILNPQAVGGICCQLGIRPRGKPKMSVFQLLMALTAHAFAPSGNLAMHAKGVSKKKISGAALSKRRRRLPWQIFEWMMDLILGVQAHPRKHPSAFWKGYRLVGIDGTMFSAKNTSGILSRVAKAASRRMESAFAKLRGVMLVELGTHHLIVAQAMVARIRIQVAQSLQGQVLQISFTKVREHVQGYWYMCQWHGDTPDENKRKVASSMIKYLIENAIHTRRARSCPRAVRQPVTGWPRLLRNQSFRGDIQCEVIRK